MRTLAARFGGKPFHTAFRRAIFAAFFLFAVAGFSSPAHALTCPDETDHSNANPVDVTYYLTENGCTKFDPGNGVLMTAQVQDASATVTFLRPGTTDPVVSTSFTTGTGCTNAGDPAFPNVSRYSYGISATCTTTVRLTSGAEFSFVAANDANQFASSLTSVRFSVPATETTIISSPNPTTFGQTANFTAVVTGGVGVPNDIVEFKDGATALGSPSLAAAGGGLSVVSIASGANSEHACAIMTNGGVKCWGRNNRGQLGNNTQDDSSTPVDVQGLASGVVALALGIEHSCALTAAGGVKCWGSNDFGRLGDGGFTERLSPVDVTGLTSGVAAIAIGDAHGCALTLAGGVKCWGFNNSGQLGNGGIAASALAADAVGLGSGVLSIAAGGHRSCAILANENRCWGDNSSGAIGDGTKNNVLTPTASGFLNFTITAFALGANHTCALTNLNAVNCWGANAQGQLGDGTVDEALTPGVAITGLGTGVAAISAGLNHSCALMATGALKCWGGNGSGQLGDGSNTQRTAPVDVASLGTGVKSIVAANSSSYAVTTGLGARSWGANGFGRLGDNLNSPRSTPSDVSGLEAGRAAASISTSALAGGNHNITGTYAGDFNRSGSTSAALVHVVNKRATATTVVAAPASPSAFGQSVTLTATVTSTAGTPGGTVAFSDNVNGALGNATLSAGGVATLPTSLLSVGAHTITATYTGSTNFANSSGTRAYTVNKGATTTTLTSSLNPSTFGQSVTFRARANAVAGSAKPTGTITITDTTTSAVLGTTALTAITQTRVQAGGGHTCSLGNDGGVTCWGNNADGQLGDGTTTNRLTPVAVSGLSSGVVAIATGTGHSCAVTAAGAVLCWGSNSLGQLGNNTTNPSSVPVSVSGLSSGVVAVAAGNSHSCALTSAGSVKCWGDAGNGQLGNNGTDNQLTPVQVVGLTGGISAIASGGSTGCAIIASGGLVCWGANALGQVGDGSAPNDQLTPVGVFGLEDSGVASVAVGNNSTCAVTTAGAALCWGGNFSGQLGDGSKFGRPTPTPVVGLESGVATIAIGSSHACAVTTAGAARCWGGNTFGELGDGGTTEQLTSVAVSGLSSGVSSISGGTGYTCARTTTGVIRCWGSNSGELGDGTTTERTTPVATLHPVASLATVTTSGLSVGVHALRANYPGDANYLSSQSALLNQTVNKAPNVITFPALANRAFGTAAPVPAATTSSGLPVSYASTTTPVCTTTGAGVITLVTVGTCSITASQAGNATVAAAAPVSRSFSVTKGANVITFPALANTSFGNIPPTPAATASSGLAVTYASTTAPVCTATGAGVITLVTVGTCSITASQAGNANFLTAAPVVRAFSVTPAATATTVASSLNPSAFGQAVTFTARVRATTGSAAPTGTVTITDTTTGATLGTPGLTVVTQAKLSAGNSHACSVASDGGVFCWGSNQDGQLGDGTTTNRLVPVPVVGLSSGVAAVAAGGRHSCALTTAGAVLCWGVNGNGQIGDGTLFTQRFTPTPVAGLSSGVVAIDAGGEHNCALKSTGALVCWGFNGNGQIGDGTTSNNRPTPVPVSGLSSGVAAISIGNSHSCALTTAGAALCWGQNLNGRVGDGTTIDRLTPVPVSGLSSGVAAIDAGINAHSCAVTTAGAVRCWGINFSGQLGDGTLVDRFAPVAVPSLSSGVASVSAGGAQSCAVTTAGAARCWGGNFSGQLGDGTSGSNRLTPVQVVGLSSGVAGIAAGSNNGWTCALTTAGAVRCWGDNTNGELGDGTTTSRLTPVATRHPGASLASLATSGLAVGAHAIRANYAATTRFTASTSPLLTQTVGKGTNTITFPALANRALGTAPPVPAATASSGLAVTYASTTTSVCTVTGAGAITLRAIGTCSIRASQAGNASFLAATAVLRSFSVTPAASTSTVATSGSPSIFGAAVTFTATVSATVGGTPAGSVTFRDGATSLGVRTLSGGTATLATAALGVGPHSITVVYGGSAVHATSTSAALTQTVNKAASTTTLTAAPNPTLVNGAVTLRATVAGTGATGNVAFRNGATTIATVALTNGAATTTFTPTSAGTLPFSAVYAGNANFNGSTSSTLGLLAHVPCSDAFAGAPALAGANGAVFGTTAGATGEAGEPNHAGGSGALNSVWCRWTAPASGPVTFDTTGSSFDTTLAVYTGPFVSVLSQVAANNNIAPGNTRSRVTFPATAGTVYRIAIDGVSATGSFVLNFAQTAAAPATFASVLPTARSITTNTVATAFATMINAGATPATGCSLASPPGFPAGFSYQATNASNVPVGAPNTPQTIAPGAAQGFVFSVTPLVDLNSSELAVVFDCANTPTSATVPGLNTLLLSSSSGPVPDLISIGSTPAGDGILNIPGNSGATAFGAATINIGAAGTVTATIDDNGRGLALIGRLCVSNPTTGACTNPAVPAPSATFTLATNTSATIAVFVTGTGPVPFDPANNRLFLRFKTADGVTRGASSVAVRTQ